MALLPNPSKLCRSPDEIDDSSVDPYIQVERFISLLQECGAARSLARGKAIHARIQESGYGDDRLLGNLVIQMYGRCGSLADARGVFDSIRDRNVYSWTIMIKASAENGQPREALQFFRRMLLDGIHPNNVTFVNVLGACESLDQARSIHAMIVASGHDREDVCVPNSLIYAYGRLQSVIVARGVFDRCENLRDLVSWNAMISVYAQNAMPIEALAIHRAMDVEGDQITVVSALDACSTLGDLARGKEIHAKASQAGLESLVAVGNAVINLYGKSGSVGDAWAMFSRMFHRNVISWTAMITAYAQNGYGREALELFKRMIDAGEPPNDVTFVTILDTCFGSATLAEGRWIHSLLIESGLLLDRSNSTTAATLLDRSNTTTTATTLMNAVVNMYTKCGSIDDAIAAFQSMPSKNVVTWSSMIAAYARFGHVTLAFESFREFVLQGGLADDVTFINLISACSHAGKLREAWDYFMLMRGEFAIDPVRQHYVCIVDLLSRSGRLVEAAELLKSMPFVPDVISWTNFLSACGAYSNLELASEALYQVSELEEECSAAYILLANIFASAGRLDDAERVRKEMADKGLKAVTESSFIWLRKQEQTERLT
ncbi:pentatricopeptide repeat-containing protein DOT4, chloroplastic [Selaginella moellendorffii]|nr:pentatricopeptide repeat-containing protein DOT4, chloroplastic [Selaginella moellendorffii]|eukprot:XP_002983273.2 pentatricopeptide repeat-containing protein DOT4, chloroplastic [Selaginella moellendorffii]